MLLLGGCLLWTMNAAAADPPASGGFLRAHYVLPPHVRREGIAFAGIKVPLEKSEVSSRIVDQLNYLLMDQRAGMLECFDRMAVYGPMVRKALEDEKVPADLIYVAVLVSRFLPNAKTKTGGVGWWGLGPPKGKTNSSMAPWIVTNDWDDRRDPVLATRIASTILQGIVKRKPNTDWLLAIASFIDGQERIDTIVEKGRGFSYWDLVMPPDSDVLIPRLIALKLIDTHREFYAVEVPPLPPLAYDFVDRLKLNKDLALHTVAKWCATVPRSMWEMNPGVDPSTGTLPKADTRSPSGFPLRVPKGMGPKVMKSLLAEGYVAK
jgi:membrane-bound lytic murein transglycosylase D